MLTVHATIEEEIFYPAARLDEAEVEHASAKELIAQIELMKASDPLYDAIMSGWVIEAFVLVELWL